MLNIINNLKPFIEDCYKKMLEPKLRPEFIKELLEAQEEEIVKVKDWDKHFSLN